MQQLQLQLDAIIVPPVLYTVGMVHKLHFGTHEFFCLGLLGSSCSKEKKVNLRFSEQLLRVVFFSTFCRHIFYSFIFFFFEDIVLIFSSLKGLYRLTVFSTGIVHMNVYATMYHRSYTMHCCNQATIWSHMWRPRHRVFICDEHFTFLLKIQNLTNKEIGK